jgi:hypothetical protein
MKDSPPDKPITLSDSDISSQPTISRRSLLNSIGVGVGVAAAVVVGAVTPAEARSDRRTVRTWCDNNRGDRTVCRRYRDRD